jgi:non-specific serine/threonine protein kinase/serine/threonine-protein kinase
MIEDKTRVLPDDSAAGPAGGQNSAQTRIGAYRLVSLLGKGGMGEVWLAERADAAYSKLVAIKFIATFLGNREAIEWFRRERQALARLEHPNIARLLDGGETEDGRPYLVMEYVDGIAIDAYCEGLPLEQVLELFLQVCSAIEHAHRALIVHRDIKPANVLVTADGQSRLLDFGIAKEMGPLPAGDEEQTRTQAYTLHYASPEQMEGRPITVASDIYSLGALLYRLLSGKVPHAHTTSALSQLQAIQTGQPQKPSRVVLEQMQLLDSERKRRSRRLHGDLDDIVLKCLRREPELRYGTAGELIDDIHRYQTHEPVLARRGSIAYRGSRYLRRHWLAIGAAAALLLTLGGGLLATYWQAQLAEKERALAQKRFDLSRSLVNDVLFDFQDRLANVPGTIDARRHLVDRTKIYLQQIAVDAQDDPGLLADLSKVERRLGDISGNPNTPNIGDTPAAAQHYSRAIQLARRARQLRPNDPNAPLALARALNSQGEFTFWGNDLVGAERAYSEAVPLFEKIAARNTSSAIQRELSQSIIGLGDVYFWNSKLELSLATYDRACKKIFANPSRDFEVLDATGVCHTRRADTLAWLERYDEAESEIAKAIAIYSARNAQQPEDINVAHSYAVALIKQGEIMMWHGKQEPGLAAYSRALELSEKQSRADPSDLRAARDVALTRSKRGDALLQANHFKEAIADYQGGLEAYKNLQKRDPTQTEHERDVAASNNRLGTAYVKSGDPKLGAIYFDAALEIMRRRWQLNPKQPWARRDLAVALQDRIEAPATAEQRCRWVAENLALLQGLKTEGVLTPADQPELDKSRKASKACASGAGAANLPASGGMD